MNTSALSTTSFELSHKAYIASTSQKTNIVLHGSFSRTKYSFTAQQNSETHLMANWNIMCDKSAGHYVIGRDGTIYSCMSEESWSNHLGNHKKFSALNKRTIAVFLCNELYLEKENSKYYAFGFNKPHNMYKGEVFERSALGYKYWADYSKPQIDSLGELLKDIAIRQSIPLTISRDTLSYNPSLSAKVGILSCRNINESSFSLPLPQWVYSKLESIGTALVS
jgi:N-acetyl-anhydromuramyl-L-alanine amidase AmpD